MAELTTFLQFLLAIALGALVGIERERFAKQFNRFMFGGIRTYLFIALLGAVSAYAAKLYTDWIMIALFFGLVTFLGISYTQSVRLSNGKSIGLTGEIVALLTFIYGVMAMGEEPVYAVVLAILTTVFLYGKERIHTFVSKLSKEEMYGALIFAIVAFVILPFLPDRTYGPLDVLNPYRIWLMVVFISGMGFVGYILIRILGSKKGIGLTGLLGGLVSSTAVTMTFAGKSRKEKSKNITRLFVFATIIANAVMIVRVLIEVYVVNKSLLSAVLIPVSTMGGVAVVAALIMWLSRKDKEEQPALTAEKSAVEHSSPLSMGPAIKFGILFGVVLFAVKLAQIYFGDTGLFIASIISGFVDVDAITLSMASLAGTEISAKVAATAITLAVMSNTIIKFGYAAIFGSKQFRNKLGIVFGLAVVAGIIALLLI